MGANNFLNGDMIYFLNITALIYRCIIFFVIELVIQSEKVSCSYIAARMTMEELESQSRGPWFTTGSVLTMA